MIKLPKELISSLVSMGAEKIYTNFSNKEALIEALIQREADTHLQILEKKYAEVRNESFEVVIEALMKEIARAMKNGKNSIRLLLTSTFAVERLESLITARESLVVFVERVLTDAGYKDNSKTKASMIVAALGGIVESIVFKKDLSLSEDQIVTEGKKLVIAYCDT